MKRKGNRGVVIRFTYDNAERLTQVGDGSGPLKDFVVAAANGLSVSPPVYQNGKLLQAIRHNRNRDRNAH